MPRLVFINPTTHNLALPVNEIIFYFFEHILQSSILDCSFLYLFFHAEVVGLATAQAYIQFYVGFGFVFYFFKVSLPIIQLFPTITRPLSLFLSHKLHAWTSLELHGNSNNNNNGITARYKCNVRYFFHTEVGNSLPRSSFVELCELHAA